MELKDKLELIKRIETYHPAAKAGRKRGWNTYTGGMRDTGNWFTWKMIEAPDSEIQDCLNELIEEFQPSPPVILSPEDQRKRDTFIVLPGGHVSNYLEMERMEEWRNDLERLIMWGKPTKI